jgi:mannose-6-phosphate isomerase-like protein (cupin superfamily)
MATKEARWVIGHRVSPVETESDYAILQIVTPPQTMGPPPHFHDSEAELFLILSGEMEVTCEGRMRTLKTGESVVIPQGSVHTFRNATDQEVTWITAFSPSRFAQFFVDFGVPASIPDALQQSVSEAMIQRVVAGCSAYGMNLAAMPVPA